MTAVFRGVKYIMGGGRFLRAWRPYAPGFFQRPDGALGWRRFLSDVATGKRKAEWPVAGADAVAYDTCSVAPSDWATNTWMIVAPDGLGVPCRQSAALLDRHGPRNADKRTVPYTAGTRRNGALSVQILQEFNVQATHSNRP